MSDKWPELPEGRRAYLGVGLVFLLLWFAARAYAIYPLVALGSDQPRLSGADSYFHLRHAESVLEHYPRIQRFDRMATFPHEVQGINQGLYDVVVATLSKLSFQTLSPAAILVWFAPLLSGLAALLLAHWLARTESLQCALVFLLLILCFPGALSHVTALGDGDHHGWEVFLQVVLLLSLDWCFKEKRPIVAALVPGLLLGLFFLSWAGSPLHLFFVGLSLYALAFFPHPEQSLKRLTGKAAILGTTILGIPLLFQKLAPSYIPWDVPLQVFVVAGATLAIGFPALLWMAQKIPANRRPLAALLGLLLGLLMIRLFPSLWGTFVDFISPRSTTISEHAAVSLKSLFRWFGVLPVALLVGPLLLWYQRRLQTYLFPLVYGLGLVLFWFYTRDFNYYAPYYIAMFAACCLARLPWRSWTPVFLLSIAALSVLPLPQQAKPWLTPDKARELMIHTNGLDEASRFLVEVKQQSEADYGLLAPWDLGNLLSYTSQTGVAYSQTHSGELARIFYSTESDRLDKVMQDRNLRFCLIPSRNVEDKLGAEFLLTGHQPKELMRKGPTVEWKGVKVTLPTFNERFYSLNIIRLFDRLARDMGHFRLVFESRQRMVRCVKLSDNMKAFSFQALQVNEEEAQALGPMFKVKNEVLPTSRGLLVNPRLSPDVRVFEYVPGALLTGRTQKPGQQVTAHLSLSSPYSKSSRPVNWQVKSENDNSFQLRLPYPTDRSLYDIEGSIVVNGPYRVECEGKVYHVSVTEEEIQSEAELPLNEFPLTKD